MFKLAVLGLSTATSYVLVGAAGLFVGAGVLKAGQKITEKKAEELVMERRFQRPVDPVKPVTS